MAKITSLPNQTYFFDMAPQCISQKAIERPKIVSLCSSSTKSLNLNLIKCSILEYDLREHLSKRGIKGEISDFEIEILSHYIKSPEELESFLNLSLENLPAIKNSATALLNADCFQKELLSSLLLGEKIFVFNDYDVDGMTSGAILKIALRSFKNFIENSKLNSTNSKDLIDHIISEIPETGLFINQGSLKQIIIDLKLEEIGNFSAYFETAKRYGHGFGLNQDAIEKAIDLNSNLIIVCDCGTPSREQEKLLSDNSIKILVVDHHAIHEGELENRDLIVVNPKQPQCQFNDHNTSTATLAGLLLKDFLIKDSYDYKWCLANAGVGGLCDVIDVRGINRILVNHASQFFTYSPPPVIKAQLKNSGQNPGKIKSDFYGFYLGPFLNAIGRMSDNGNLGVDLLSSDNLEEVSSILEKVNNYNISRKSLELKLTQIALRTFDFEKAAIVDYFAFDDFSSTENKGVIGIIAGTFARKFNKPCFLFSENQDGNLTASGRSIEGFNITDALDEIKASNKDIFIAYGGHALAAGCSIKKSNFSRFKSEFERIVKKAGLDNSQIKINYKHTINLKEVNYKTYKALHRLIEPTGPGVLPPIIKIPEILIDEILESNETNLTIRVRQGQEVRFARFFKEAPYWHRVKEHPLKVGAFVDLYGTLNIEKHHGDLVTRIYLQEILPHNSDNPNWYQQETTALSHLKKKMKEQLLPWHAELKPGLHDESQSFSDRKILKISDLKYNMAHKSASEDIISKEESALKSTKINSEFPDTEPIDQPLEIIKYSEFSFEALEKLEEKKLYKEISGQTASESSDEFLTVEHNAPSGDDSIVENKLEKNITSASIIAYINQEQIETPNSIKELYKKYPTKIIRTEDIGYRAYQVSEIAIQREILKKYGFSHIIYRSKVDTGKTKLSIQAVAPVIESNNKVLIITSDNTLVKQFKKSVLETLKLNDEEILCISGEISTAKRQELYKSLQYKIIIATAGAIFNDLETKRLDQVFHGLIVDEIHELRGDSNLSKLMKYIYPKLPDNSIFVGMSADPQKNEALTLTMIDEFCSKAILREITTPSKIIDFRIEEIRMHQDILDAYHCFERKLVPIAEEIKAILDPLKVPREISLELLEALPNKSRPQKKLEKFKKLKKVDFSWGEQFSKIVRFKRDGVLKVTSTSEIGSFVKDFSESIRFYKANFRIDHKVISRMEEANKWLLTFHEIFYMSHTLASSEKYAFFDHAIRRAFKVQYGIKGKNKASHFEKLVFEDKDIKAAMLNLSEGTLYGEIFKQDFNSLLNFISNKTNKHFLPIEDALEHFLELCEADLIQKIINNSVSNGPKTDKNFEIHNLHLNSDPFTKGIVFSYLANNALFLNRLTNHMSHNYKSSNFVSAQKLNYEQRIIQNQGFLKFKENDNNVRVLYATDAARQGKHVENTGYITFFNPDTRAIEFNQEVGRSRVSSPIVYILASEPLGPDKSMAGASIAAYHRINKPYNTASDVVYIDNLYNKGEQNVI